MFVNEIMRDNYAEERVCTKHIRLNKKGALIRQTYNIHEINSDLDSKIANRDKPWAIKKSTLKIRIPSTTQISFIFLLFLRIFDVLILLYVFFDVLSLNKMKLIGKT